MSDLILTEEEWKERCRLLVLENDELMAENVKLTKERDKFKGIAKLFIDGDQIDLVYEVLKLGKPKEESNHE